MNRLPRYKVEEQALNADGTLNETFATEAAKRYVESLVPRYTREYTGGFKTRLVGAYLLGLAGVPSQQWSNYERPLARAHSAGRALRKLLGK